MEYVVYVNRPTSKATVHDAHCSLYRGRVADATKNCFWKARIATLHEAMTYAQNTQKRHVGACGRCI